MTDHGLLLTVPDVAQRLAVSEPSVWRLIRRNAITVVRIGRSTRISQLAVDRFIERHERFDCGSIELESRSEAPRRTVANRGRRPKRTALHSRN